MKQSRLFKKMSAEKLIGFEIKKIVPKKFTGNNNKETLYKIVLYIKKKKKKKKKSLSSFKASVPLFIIPEKLQKISVFLMFSGVTERQKWPEKSLNRDKSTTSSTILTNKR